MMAPCRADPLARSGTRLAIRAGLGYRAPAMPTSLRTLSAVLTIALLANACGKGASGIESSPTTASSDTVAVPPVARASLPPPPASAPVAAASASASTSATAADSLPPPPTDGPHIYSKARHVWIRYEPSASSGWMGFMGLGGAVKLRPGAPRPGDGCNAFYPVEPRGWVCLDDRTTLDPNDPEYVAVRYFAPRLDTPFPHHYGESRGTPRYLSIPTPEEQRRREPNLDEHLHNLELLREGKLSPEDVPPGLRGVDPTPAGQPPPDILFRVPRVQEERDYIKPLSTIAWSHEFDAQGRTWLVTADVMLVPKDRVSPYPVSTFHGVRLEDGVSLPFVFVREKPRPKYRRNADGSIVPTGESWPRFARFPADPQIVQSGDKSYVVSKEDGLLIDEADATVVKPSLTTPWGAIVDGVPEEEARKVVVQRVPPPDGPRKTWVEVSVLSGWLIAYEGTRPVFATLIAPGRGGVPRRGVDPLKDAATPTGYFRIDGKFWTATMANNAFVHSDVPFAQNFHGPHALHMAYWHDDWGQKKSGGCINLSPEDARWFFLWTEPAIPDGWFGIRSDKQAGPASIVIVHS